MSGIFNYILNFVYSLVNIVLRTEFTSFLSLTVVACGLGIIVLIVKLVTKLKAFALFGG